MEETGPPTLATFLQRLLAYILDTVMFYLPLTAAAALLVVGVIFAVGGGDTPGSGGLAVALLALAAIGFLLAAGYIIWWWVTLKNGQTPGKQLVGIRVVRENGEPSGWGYTFLREFVIKGLLGGVLSSITGGIYTVVDHLWPLWDQKRQALHDKMVNTIVVQNRS